MGISVQPAAAILGALHFISLYSRDSEEKTGVSFSSSESEGRIIVQNADTVFLGWFGIFLKN